jgi:prepilin-type N-terminal cleavage/methylation domain-containing protein
MPARRLGDESGYSLIEVMVSIVIMTLAILPMVAMFDMGFSSATLGSNYDKARTLANVKLEQAKTLPYEIVRTNFPSEAASGKGPPDASGSITSSSVTSPGDPRVPSPTFSYVVTKRYLEQPSSCIPTCPGGQVSEPFNNSATDNGLLKVTVTVSWLGNTFRTSGVVAN